MSLNIEKYHSNDWLIPIGDRAQKVFQSLPRRTAIEIAEAILIQEDAGGADIPWVTVFPSDDLDEVCPLLLEVLRTPDGKTPAYDPNFKSAMDDLKLILYQEGASGGFLACPTACYLVGIAAGKTEEHSKTYRDLARKWPQYSGKWVEDLKEQFGARKVRTAARKHKELFRILQDNQNIVPLAANSNRRIPGENTAEFLQRAISSLNITDTEDLNRATRLLESRLDVYRAAAYQIRGIPFIQ